MPPRLALASRWARASFDGSIEARYLKPREPAGSHTLIPGGLANVHGTRFVASDPSDTIPLLFLLSASTLVTFPRYVGFLFLVSLPHPTSLPKFARRIRPPPSRLRCVCLVSCFLGAPLFQPNNCLVPKRCPIRVWRGWPWRSERHPPHSRARAWQCAFQSLPLIRSCCPITLGKKLIMLVSRHLITSWFLCVGQL